MTKPVNEIVMAEGFTLMQRGNSWRGACPLHEGGQGRSNPFAAWETGFKCWSCGESGDGPAFIMKLKGMTFPQALAYLGQERKRPTRQEKAKATRERKKRLAAEWRERDLAWTLAKLIRTARTAMLKMTPENFDEYAGIIDNVTTWERWHDVFIYGSKEDRAAMMEELKDFPIFKRGRLFREDFDFIAWLRGCNRPEGKPEPHKNEIKRIKIHVERV